MAAASQRKGVRPSAPARNLRPMSAPATTSDPTTQAARNHPRRGSPSQASRTCAAQSSPRRALDGSACTGGAAASAPAARRAASQANPAQAAAAASAAHWNADRGPAGTTLQVVLTMARNGSTAARSAR